MTAETLAAAILRDVERIVQPSGTAYLHEGQVLAALSRAMSNDLAERAVFHLLVLRDDLGQWSKQSADLITALLVQNAALRAERDHFEAALGRACLVGGTTYLVEKAQKAEARAENAEAERDAAYAKGFSDAETEISATAIGQQNIALHDQLSRAKVERGAANALLRAAVSKIQSLYDGIAPLGEGRFAEADETVQAARAHLGAKP